MQNEFFDLFKIPSLNVILNLNNIQLIKNKINKIRKEKGRKISNLTGYQSNDLKIDSTFLSFKRLIETKSNNLAKQIGLKDNLILNNLWININKFKDVNDLHNHPHSILSGCFYIKVPKNSGAIVFKTPSAPLVDIYWRNHLKNFTVYNSPFWKIFPVEKQLLIFPSWLEHSVEPNMNEKEERISIAFNLHYESSELV